MSLFKLFRPDRHTPTMSLFKLTNPDRYKMVVQLEPWAEVYYLRKGQEMELRQPVFPQGYYHLKVWEDGDVQIFVGGEFDNPQVFIDGEEAQPWNDFV